jgi:hypothetical protein
MNPETTPEERAARLVEFLQAVALGELMAGDAEVTAAVKELDEYLPHLD